MPTLDDVLAYFRANRQRWKEQYGVKEIAVFGSLARGESTKDSDIDVLVDMPDPTLRTYMGLKFEIEDHFKRTVDLVRTDVIRKEIQSEVKQEAIHA